MLRANQIEKQARRQKEQRRKTNDQQSKRQEYDVGEGKYNAEESTVKYY